MDGQRFDDITRAFAVGRSRRAVLRTVLGGLGAGVLALVGGANADAASTRSCAEGCRKQFGPGRKRGQCISDCVRGTAPAPVSCGGIGGFRCPEGSICVDDPTDECDPATGGADCGGICRPACGDTVCGAGDSCCNASCGICAPTGGSCTQEVCGG